ncbi:MAG: TonB-dependent receptor plug domain-containing protein [Chitinispirillaceae bacterium]|nr:TonB-dependent receptor plug domain-containing protein [Chitinispirillaceae bacterium]
MIRTFKAIALPLILLSAMPVGSTVKAEEPELEENLDVIDELSLGNLLNMEITTGSFLELDLKKSPLSMTIISDEMIRASGARNMSELLEIYVPGFIYNINKWNGTLWGMRGVSNDRNTKIIYLVNGHKMNTQARDGTQQETLLGLLGDIERVEVLRGPAGLVYGTGAIAGIINVVTGKADTDGSNVTVSGRTDGSRSIEANFYSKPADNQQLSLSAGFLESEGFPYDQVRIYGTDSWPYSPGVRQGAPSDGRLGRTDGNFRMSGDWTIGDFNLYFRATRQKEPAAPYFIRDPWPEVFDAPDSNGTSTYQIIDGKEIQIDDPYWSTAEHYYNGRRLYKNDNFFAEGSYEVPLDDNSLKIKLSFDMNTTAIEGEVLSKWEDYEPWLNGRRSETFGEKRYNISSTYLLKSVPQLQAAFGVEYHLDAVGPDMEGKNEQSYNSKKFNVTEINYHTFTLFGEGFYDITEILGAHVGLRLDVHTRAIMFNPKVAMVVRPSDNHSIKLIYQSASNNGSVDNYEIQRFHTNDSGEVVTVPVNANPKNLIEEGDGMIQPVPGEDVLHDLKPETVHSIELAYVGRLMDNLTVEPSVAWGMVKDLFGWSQDLFRVVNVGEYHYINIDADMRYTSRKFQFGINHTFQRPVMTDPDKQKKTYMMYEWTDSAGIWNKFNGIDGDGDSTWTGYFEQSKETDLNVVKNSVTYDGKNFMSLPTHMTKMYMIVSPFDWISLSTSLRVIWGLPGKKPLVDNDTTDHGYYYGFYDGLNNKSFKDYLMNSVSKKWNAGLNFHLPKDFDVGFYVYHILGTDEHKYGYSSKELIELDRNTVNTFRISQAFDHYCRGLYSADQRAFGVTVTKYF